MSKLRCRVTPITKLTAVSSNPTASGRVYPLSVSDLAMARHSAAVVMYYGENPFGSFVLDPMRQSLSRVLNLYPNVTGRLTRLENGNWGVKGNDAGVRVTMTKVGTTLDEWLRSADSAEERDLAAIDDMPEDPHIWSHFRIQINEFEGGGVAIGVSFTHMVADPTSATFLLKTWAEAHRGEPVTPPLVTCPSVEDCKKISNIASKSTSYYANKSKAYTHFPTKMSSITFKFSNSTMNQCLSEITEDCPNATPFDLLAALFWMRVLHIKGLKKEVNSSLSICIDHRKSFKFANPPMFYFGNALHFSQLIVAPKEMDQYELRHVVGLLHHHVQRLVDEENEENEDQEILSALDWLKSQKDSGGKYAPPFAMYGPELTCVNMEHMVNGNDSLAYSTTFVRDSKPVHVSYNVGNVDGEGLIVVMPSNEGGVARNVMVMLPEREVAELCEDQAILSFKPTMILGGNQFN